MVAGDGWEAGWPRGPQELRTRGWGRGNGDIGRPRTTTIFKKPTTNPTPDQGQGTRD